MERGLTMEASRPNKGKGLREERTGRRDTEDSLGKGTFGERLGDG